MGLDPAQFTTFTASQFAQTVKSLSDKELRELLGGDKRTAVLDAVFDRFPEAFRPEKAGEVSKRINFRITGGPGDTSNTYALVVDSGACSIEREPETDPDISLMLGPAEFMKLIGGVGNPVMMFMTGKIKARGDISLATALQNWFETPRA